VAVHAPRAETVEAWAERMNRSGKYRCRCGCGTELVILPRHRSMGLPRYVHGHHPNPLRRGFDALRRKGYKLVGEVAKLLGVSPTTLRRMEHEGVIPKVKRVEFVRGRSVRVYGAKDVERLAKSRLRTQPCNIACCATKSRSSPHTLVLRSVLVERR
jgi:excisionase family DNA binding protein